MVQDVVEEMEFFRKSVAEKSETSRIISELSSLLQCKQEASTKSHALRPDVPELAVLDRPATAQTSLNINAVRSAASAACLLEKSEVMETVSSGSAQFHGRAIRSPPTLPSSVTTGYITSPKRAFTPRFISSSITPITTSGITKISTPSDGEHAASLRSHSPHSLHSDTIDLENAASISLGERVRMSLIRLEMMSNPTKIHAAITDGVSFDQQRPEEPSSSTMASPRSHRGSVATLSTPCGLRPDFRYASFGSPKTSASSTFTPRPNFSFSTPSSANRSLEGIPFEATPGTATAALPKTPRLEMLTLIRTAKRSVRRHEVASLSSVRRISAYKNKDVNSPSKHSEEGGYGDNPCMESVKQLHFGDCNMREEIPEELKSGSFVHTKSLLEGDSMDISMPNPPNHRVDDVAAIEDSQTKAIAAAPQPMRVNDAMRMEEDSLNHVVILQETVDMQDTPLTSTYFSLPSGFYDDLPYFDKHSLSFRCDSVVDLANAISNMEIFSEEAEDSDSNSRINEKPDVATNAASQKLPNYGNVGLHGFLHLQLVLPLTYVELPDFVKANKLSMATKNSDIYSWVEESGHTFTKNWDNILANLLRSIEVGFAYRQKRLELARQIIQQRRARYKQESIVQKIVERHRFQCIKTALSIWLRQYAASQKRTRVSSTSAATSASSVVPAKRKAIEHGWNSSQRTQRRGIVGVSAKPGVQSHPGAIAREKHISERDTSSRSMGTTKKSATRSESKATIKEPLRRQASNNVHRPNIPRRLNSRTDLSLQKQAQAMQSQTTTTSARSVPGDVSNSRASHRSMMPSSAPSTYVQNSEIRPSLQASSIQDRKRAREESIESRTRALQRPKIPHDAPTSARRSASVSNLPKSGDSSRPSRTRESVVAHHSTEKGVGSSFNDTRVAAQSVDEKPNVNMELEISATENSLDCGTRKVVGESNPVENGSAGADHSSPTSPRTAQAIASKTPAPASDLTSSETADGPVAPVSAKEEKPPRPALRVLHQASQSQSISRPSSVKPKLQNMAASTQPKHVNNQKQLSRVPTSQVVTGSRPQKALPVTSTTNASSRTAKINGPSRVL